MSQATAETPHVDFPLHELADAPTPALSGAALRIVFATDGSAMAREAEQCLAQLPLPAGSTLQVVTVMEGPGCDVTDCFLDSVREWAQETAAQAALRLARAGVVVSSDIRLGPPAYEIIRAAENADLVVLGAQGMGALEAFLVGSVARNVAKHSPCSVLVARKPEHRLRSVVLAVDGSEHAARAVSLLNSLPLSPVTEVRAVHVIRHAHPHAAVFVEKPAELQQEAEEAWRRYRQAGVCLLAGAADRLKAGGRRASAALREGDPATEILRVAAERQADLIVAGARGVSLIQGLVVGSVADRLLKQARCSLLLVR